jgi:hypothetical protein
MFESQSKCSNMPDIIQDNHYDEYRKWISRHRNEKKLSWDEIVKKGTQTWLHDYAVINGIDELNEHQWQTIVMAKKKEEEDSLVAAEAGVLGLEVDPDILIPDAHESCWVLYKNRLLEEGWDEEAISSIGNSSLMTLRRFKEKTDPAAAVKGLVVGHVQSGKTANMAGLIAMAADWGYNFFIVLSGTIENLRKQTQDRLYGDLSGDRLNWHSLHQLAPNSLNCPHNLSLAPNSRARYITVSLKNPSRLRSLYEWLIANQPSLSLMKIVIIDDEADQASINVGRENNRSKINKLIVKLTELKAKAVNYVSYTATPYANFLNEAYEESLYPKDFIVPLRQSPEHFGPGHIFGLEGRFNAVEKPCDGIDIVRNIPSDSKTAGEKKKNPKEARKETWVSETDEIVKIHKNQSSALPESFKDSIAWFLCATATRMLWEIKKPTSMLIHTSQKVDHHANIATAVEKWLNSKPTDILSRCEKIWDSETNRFTIERFKEQFPEYGCSQGLKEYPAFAHIKDGIIALLNRVEPVRLGDEGIPEYHKGIHLCIDNSKNNGVNFEKQIIRLVYPPTPLDHLTAFIVIGGSTLSRGLTLEGLVSTYFIRDSNQMDTLMQMGRWFGYRKGYELLPRIWMTSRCTEKFAYLALVEKELREELCGYAQTGLSPAEYAPRVKNSYAVSWLRPTAKARMKRAQTALYDYSGANSQTTIFSADPDILRHNIKVTESFLTSLKRPRTSNSGKALVWGNVEFDQIKKFFKNFTFHPRAKLFGNIGEFIEWYEKIDKDVYNAWNVVAAGIIESTEEWEIGDFRIKKIERSRLKRQSNEGSLAIGVLRTPKDLLADVENLSELSEKGLDNEAIIEERKKAGLENTPQLLIYRIRKDSKTDASLTREDLGALDDIIGISLWIPGVRDKKGNPQNFAQYVSVCLPALADNGSDLL